MGGLEWLTLALVIVNGIFAWLMLRSVQEMRKSRELQVRPKLAPDLHVVGPALAFLRLSNVGQGPALDVKVRVVLVARDGGEGDDDRLWRCSLFVPGENHEFLPPDAESKVYLTVDELVQRYRCLALRGTMRDSLGNSIRVDEESGDLEETWGAMKASHQRVEQDQMKKIADAVEMISKK